MTVEATSTRAASQSYRLIVFETRCTGLMSLFSGIIILHHRTRSASCSVASSLRVRRRYCCFSLLSCLHAVQRVTEPNRAAISESGNKLMSFGLPSCLLARRIWEQPSSFDPHGCMMLKLHYELKGFVIKYHIHRRLSSALPLQTILNPFAL